jgi:hypothetical protein
VKIGLVLVPQEALKAEEQSLPAKAVQFMQQNSPPGPLFNSYNWGGYLIFKLWPDYPVYIDGRTDLYDDAFLRRYLNVATGGEGWRQSLDEDGINLVLIESDSTLAKFLAGSSAWTKIYQDNLATVFVRKTVVSQ